MMDSQDYQGTVEDWLIYKDDQLLVVNKPAGLRTIQDGYDHALPHLFGLLASHFGRVWIVHRLDKETSGVILFTRSLESHRQLNQQFNLREVEKTYHALVTGSPPWEQIYIDLPLLVDGDRKHRTIVDHQRGKSANSAVEVLGRFPNAALLAVRPTSGYTHQIRAHLAAAGFPILFDPLYRRSTDPPNPTIAMPTRLALHAHQIRFIHPHSKEAVQFEAPYPPDFKCMLAAVKGPSN
jgi:tRNA pseudouridine32 synthase / 23S rRNA pseudouridine746 synthase